MIELYTETITDPEHTLQNPTSVSCCVWQTKIVGGFEAAIHKGDIDTFFCVCMT